MTFLTKTLGAGLMAVSAISIITGYYPHINYGYVLPFIVLLIGYGLREMQ